VRTRLETPRTPRGLEKRALIEDAAIRRFLSDGFESTTMDGIAEAAGVSKRTVYDHFGDKERLFTAVVSSVVGRAGRITAAIAEAFESMTDPRQDLSAFALEYAAAVLSPDIVSLRRLVIREAERFPELARTYYDSAPGAAIAALSEGFELLSSRGLLDVIDSKDAAQQFAYLVLGDLMDRALFLPGGPPSADAIEQRARSAVAMFLRAHST